MSEPYVQHVTISPEVRNRADDIRTRAGKVFRAICQRSAPAAIILDAEEELVAIAAAALALRTFIRENQQ